MTRAGRVGQRSGRSAITSDKQPSDTGAGTTRLFFLRVVSLLFEKDGAVRVGKPNFTSPRAPTAARKQVKPSQSRHRLWPAAM